MRELVHEKDLPDVEVFAEPYDPLDDLPRIKPAEPAGICPHCGEPLY